MGLQREHINLTSTCIDIEYYCNSGLHFVSVALNVGATFKRCDKPWGLVMWGPSIGEAAVVLLLHWKNFGKRWKNFALPSFSLTTYYYEIFVAHPYYPGKIFLLSFSEQ